MVFKVTAKEETYFSRVFLMICFWVVLGLVVFADLRCFYHHPYCGKFEINIAPLCSVLVNWAFAVKRIYLLILELSLRPSVRV